MLHVTYTLLPPFESESLETQHNFCCTYVSSGCMINPVCKLKICWHVKYYLCLNYSCLCYGMVSAQVLPWDKQTWGTLPPSAAGSLVTVQWHFVSRYCEKLFPGQLTAEFCFLQKEQENVVASLKAQLHFRELPQKYCHSHLPLNIF